MRKLLLALFLAACGDSTTDDPAAGSPPAGAGNPGGASAGGSGGNGVATGGTGGMGTNPAACDNGEADGTCSEDEFASAEACRCPDCATTAFCVIDQCIEDNSCTLRDACTCADCDDDSFCSGNCQNDGRCDSFLEGCACPDCYEHPHCRDNNPTTTTTTGAGGTGGNGGAGGDGGASGVGGSATGGEGGGGSPPMGCGPSSTGTCVELPPVGWSGPVVVYDGPSAAPSCGGAYGTEVFSGHGTLACGTHSCSPCACAGTPIGGGCAASPDITVYANPGCTGFFYHFSGSTSGCYSLSSSFGGSSAVATIDYALGATCAAPSGGAPMTAQPAWLDEALVCAATLDQLGCSPSEACAEEATPPFGSAVCIATSDVQECPIGSAYSNRTIYYTDYDDSRGCNASCSCSAFDKQCSNVVNLLQDFCTDPGEQLPADGVCHNDGYSGNGFSSTVGSPVEGTGTCNAGGSVASTGSCAPSGGVGEGAVTVCCL